MENNAQFEKWQARWHWRDLQVDVNRRFPTEEPAEPRTGTGWYNPAIERLYVWDGGEWVCVPLD
jgi:hypothetical protein